jgi:dTDP-4-amino-4,6-dideoxygalactose transaminase
LLSLVEGVIGPYCPESMQAVYHLYVIRVRDRDYLQEYLTECGIGTGMHYPVPLHLQKAYKHLGYKLGDFAIAERMAPEIVSLPMFPHLTAEQQTRVVDEIARFLQKSMIAEHIGVCPFEFEVGGENTRTRGIDRAIRSAVG